MRRVHPQSGDERDINRFLWYPVMINNDWRWLERAPIRQEYTSKGWVTTAFGDTLLIEKIEGETYTPGKIITREEAKRALKLKKHIEWTLFPNHNNGWISVSSAAHNGGQYRIAP